MKHFPKYIWKTPCTWLQNFDVFLPKKTPQPSSFNGALGFLEAYLTFKLVVCSSILKGCPCIVTAVPYFLHLVMTLSRPWILLNFMSSLHLFEVNTLHWQALNLILDKRTDCILHECRRKEEKRCFYAAHLPCRIIK